MLFVRIFGFATDTANPERPEATTWSFFQIVALFISVSIAKQ